MPRTPQTIPLGGQHQQTWPEGSQLFRQQLSQVAGQVPIQLLNWPVLEAKGITAYLRRDDLISPTCSGNKFYKLYFNLQQARQQGCNTLVSFGGAYSNHIHALAAAASMTDMHSIGIIRGHWPKKLSPTLEDACKYGMKLHFLNKKDYGGKHISEILPILKEAGKYHLIPEGGANLAGVRGCMAISQALKHYFQDRSVTICTAAGTGSTFAGLVAGAGEGLSCLGFSVLKGDDRLSDRVRYYLDLLGQQQAKNWRLLPGYHHGGYAKVTNLLLTFMAEFEQRNGLQLEPVYTAKMLWAIEQLAQQDYWPRGTTLVALHSGGLQGRRGFKLDADEGVSQ